MLLDEQLLIKQLKQGTEASFKTLVENWQNMVFNTAFNFVQNEEDAEDVAQEVFVQVYNSIHSFKGDAKLSTWLYKITVSKSLDMLRRKKRKKRQGVIKSLFGNSDETENISSDIAHPGISIDQKEHATALYNALNRLPDNQKTAFTLNKIEGLNYQEVSDIMNTSTSAVESLIHRAKSGLKKILEIYYKNALK